MKAADKKNRIRIRNPVNGSKDPDQNFGSGTLVFTLQLLSTPSDSLPSSFWCIHPFFCPVLAPCVDRILTSDLACIDKANFLLQIRQDFFRVNFFNVLMHFW
jgi:hypothetical protein